MIFNGEGLLVGYKAIKKDNNNKHQYFVLTGDKNGINGLYDDLGVISIIQDKQTLEFLKPQRVTFNIEIIEGNFNFLRYFNIQTKVEEE